MDSINERIERWANMKSPDFWVEADNIDETIAVASITDSEKLRLLARMKDVLNAYDTSQREDQWRV